MKAEKIEKEIDILREKLIAEIRRYRDERRLPELAAKLENHASYLSNVASDYAKPMSNDRVIEWCKVLGL